jgi:hypothetical protein
MQTLEVELGNKREIETRFDYNILQDITNSTTFTTQQLKEIFTGFPVDQAKENARLLAQAKKELSINNGSSIVTGNISPALPTSLE